MGSGEDAGRAEEAAEETGYLYGGKRRICKNSRRKDIGLRRRMKKCEESRRKRHWPTVENEKTVKIAEEKGISLRWRMRKLRK